ncbi:antibiotic biosynthesis monooxygenase [Nocardia farcinica]|uniref:Autoinducer 2-degrading protein lsrG n=1 Tax=Nocardia farcinica TaxID=37329 RepID=A0A0H5NNM9_NOCFR|nr:putative quinol monooxygenase [Nocardia farcinica]SLG97760.1 antibiotic biosynthesis monooxygenase [Mycobacteroides abscessus subsp. abscessus]AXK85371.1 antibiotic biosynthesis monooxygenase [Nocardia farcinica]MBA4859239.1 antibiotic biosynthesis monooxygenase [Nocardia farcinica]MBC9819470.1 antibiotic biosynthesis monooxygenase [Nocardia farcinica]MBF6143248.1 antibiotic biosynthesis monooxygenase [Nocardia farcinica]
MIFIVVKFDVRDEYVDTWPSITREFTDATRAEAGNLWFEWHRSLSQPTEFVLLEAFRDAAAGADHVNADHFRKGLEAMRPALRSTPRILHAPLPDTDWARMGELEIVG